MPAKPQGCQPSRPERRGINISSFITEEEPTYAERQIEDEHMGVEVFLVPTVVSSREVGCGVTPKVWVDDLTVELNIERDEKRSSRPEPNLDSVLLATREGVESTSIRVEIFAVRILFENLGTTTLVEVEVGVTVR